MNPIKLSIATTDYDHFRDFRTGDVHAEGIDYNWSMLSHHEVFARFTANREWDVAELSFAKFSAQISILDGGCTRKVCGEGWLPHYVSFLYHQDVLTTEDIHDEDLAPEPASCNFVFGSGEKSKSFLSVDAPSRLQL